MKKILLIILIVILSGCSIKKDEEEKEVIIEDNNVVEEKEYTDDNPIKLGLFLYDILYTAIASAIYVMPYEMAVTNKARNKIFLFNILFSLINFGAPMILNSQLDKLIEHHADVFPLVMAGMGIVCGAIVFVSTFFYKENKYTK